MLVKLNRCHKRLGPVFLCDIQEECEAGMPIKECADDLIRTGRIKPEHLSVYTADCLQKGYCDSTIEVHFVILDKEKDATIDYLKSTDDGKKDHYSKSWRDIIVEQGHIKPLPFTAKATGRYSLRASERGCDISRIIAKLDEDRLKELGLKTPSESSIAGKVRHALGNSQLSDDCVHNNLLVKEGIVPQAIPRSEYCEVEMRYISGDDIVVSGHPDALFHFENKHGLGSLDFKRKPRQYYMLHDHLRQELIYDMGVAQMLKLTPDMFYGITIHRPFKEVRGNLRLPVYRFFRIPNNIENPAIREVDSELLRSYREQAKILHDRNHFYRVSDEMSVCDACLRKVGYQPEPVECFSKKACDFLRENSDSEQKSLVEILDDFKLIPDEWEIPVC
ncbi:MAG: hypothetical protein V1839_02120 [archaeon]